MASHSSKYVACATDVGTAELGFGGSSVHVLQIGLGTFDHLANLDKSWSVDFLLGASTKIAWKDLGALACTRWRSVHTWYGFKLKDSNFVFIIIY